MDQGDIKIIRVKVRNNSLDKEGKLGWLGINVMNSRGKRRGVKDEYVYRISRMMALLESVIMVAR